MISGAGASVVRVQERVQILRLGAFCLRWVSSWTEQAAPALTFYPLIATQRTLLGNRLATHYNGLLTATPGMVPGQPPEHRLWSGRRTCENVVYLRPVRTTSLLSGISSKAFTPIIIFGDHPYLQLDRDQFAIGLETRIHRFRRRVARYILTCESQLGTLDQWLEFVFETAYPLPLLRFH